MVPLLRRKRSYTSMGKKEKTSASCFTGTLAREVVCILVELHHWFSQNLSRYDHIQVASSSSRLMV